VGAKTTESFAVDMMVGYRGVGFGILPAARKLPPEPLARRPSERPACQHVQVNVAHALAGVGTGVHHHAKPLSAKPASLASLVANHQQFSKQAASSGLASIRLARWRIGITS